MPNVTPAHEDQSQGSSCSTSSNTISSNGSAKFLVSLDEPETVRAQKVTIKNWSNKGSPTAAVDNNSSSCDAPFSSSATEPNSSSTSISKVSISSNILKCLMKAPNAITIPLAALQKIAHNNQDNGGGNVTNNVQHTVSKNADRKQFSNVHSQKETDEDKNSCIILDSDESMDVEHHSTEESHSNVSSDEDVYDRLADSHISSKLGKLSSSASSKSAIASSFSPDLLDESSVEFLDSFDPVSVCPSNCKSFNGHDLIGDEIFPRRIDKRKNDFSVSHSSKKLKATILHSPKVSIKKPTSCASEETQFFSGSKSAFSVCANSAKQRHHLSSKQYPVKKHSKIRTAHTEFKCGPDTTSGIKSSLGLVKVRQASNTVKINPPSPKLLQKKNVSSASLNTPAVASGFEKIIPDSSKTVCLGVSSGKKPSEFHSHSSDSCAPTCGRMTSTKTPLHASVKINKKTVIQVDTSKENKEKKIVHSLKSLDVLYNSKSGLDTAQKRQQSSKSCMEARANSGNVASKLLNSNSAFACKDQSQSQNNTSVVLSEEKASQTSHDVAVNSKLCSTNSADSVVVGNGSLLQVASNKDVTPLNNSIKYVPVTNTIVTQCINNPIHYFAGRVAPCQLKNNLDSSMKIALPQNIIHAIPINTINLKSPRLQIPSVALVPGTSQYVLASPSSANFTISKNGDTSPSVHAALTIPTENGPHAATNIKLPSPGKILQTPPVVGVNVLPFPVSPNSASETASLTLMPPVAAADAVPSKALRSKSAESIIKVKFYTGINFINDPTYPRLPTGKQNYSIYPKTISSPFFCDFCNIKMR